MSRTQYDRYFQFSLFDVIPARWDIDIEWPYKVKFQSVFRFDPPRDWGDIFCIKAFTVEDAAEPGTDADDILFWGAVWFILLGFDLKTGIYIGK